jgi:hypothetical protein
MKSFVKNDGSIYATSDWFLAKLTAECNPDPADKACGNYTYSWTQLSYCETMLNFTSDELQLITGDCVLGENAAVAIDGKGTVGSTVLMRYRGSVYNEENNDFNVFEFVTGGGGGQVDCGDTVCFGLKSISCNTGVLSAVYSDAGGCLSNCTGGLAMYQLGEVEVNNNTNTPLSDWNLLFGDLELVGMEFDAGKFTNTWGSEITLRVTMNYSWTPEPSINGTTRGAFIVKNDDNTQVPLGNFAASDNERMAQNVTGIFKIANGDFFKANAFQNSGANLKLSESTNPIKTTILIERLCS